MQAASIFTANHHGERVVESKSRPYSQVELCFVTFFHSSIHILLVAAWLFFENRSQRRAGVFRVDIDSSGENCLLTDECAGQVETTLDGNVSAGFDSLRE